MALLSFPSPVTLWRRLWRVPLITLFYCSCLLNSHRNEYIAQKTREGLLPHRHYKGIIVIVRLLDGFIILIKELGFRLKGAINKEVHRCVVTAKVLSPREG